MEQLRLFTLRYESLKTSLRLHAALAVETRVADGKWLKNQLNLKLRHAPRRKMYADCFEVREAIFIY